MAHFYNYSSTWYTTFLESIEPAQTAAEIAFLTRHLPRPDYEAVLDVCCGIGRHAHLLAEQGYHVTGIDVNEEALTIARARSAGKVEYHQLDMRHLETLPGTYDAILCLWQSFGYFDEATNQAILGQISQKLRPGGRFILDIYHRHFFEQHQGSRRLERFGVPYTETKQVQHGRLTVRLDYGPAAQGDQFEWQLYTPAEITATAGRFHLLPLLSCTSFDETRPPSADLPRMQLIFARSSP